MIAEELKQQLLAVLSDRLNAGDIMVAESQFQKAVEEGYAILGKGEPSAEIKTELGALIREINGENPEVLVVPGIENWITMSVLAQVRKARWGIVEVQEQGQQAVREFVRGAKAQAVLKQMNVLASQINAKRCLRTIVNTVAGKEDPHQKRSAARLAQLKAKAAAAPPPEAPRPSPEENLKNLLSGQVELPSEQEAEERTQQEKAAQVKIRKAQMAELVNNLDAYVAQGKLSADEAERLRKVHTVDAAVRSGKVTAEKGSKIRNTLLSGNVRDKIDKKVKDAMDYVVVYLQVFQALQRMDPKFDRGMRFLIRHKVAVNADNVDGEKSPDLGPAVTALMEDLEVINGLIDMMDRKDAEVRMMAAMLPPYSYIVRRDQGRIENLVIEESFVDDLRNLSEEDLSGRLNSPDKKVRGRQAADMLCVMALVNRVLKATPFRKELRVLKINLIVEEFYRSTENLEEARTKAQEFLRTRLKSLYTDITDEETAEIERRGAEIIEAVEQKIVAERKEKAAAEGNEADSQRGEEDGESLSEEEKQKGVQIRRVDVRVAGRIRSIPYKIMPDVDDAAKFVIVQRDPETGELTAVRRRGSKRYVERNKDGRWQLS